jgi:hypothetical protein
MVAPGGISRVMLAALRDNTRRLGFTDLYGPFTPFGEYVARRRVDGQPYDSWVRAHLRLGAQIGKVAPCSMVIAGTLAEWVRHPLG